MGFSFHARTQNITFLGLGCFVKDNFVAFGLVQLFSWSSVPPGGIFPFVPQREWYRDIKKIQQ